MKESKVSQSELSQEQPSKKEWVTPELCTLEIKLGGGSGGDGAYETVSS